MLNRRKGKQTPEAEAEEEEPNSGSESGSESESNQDSASDQESDSDESSSTASDSSHEEKVRSRRHRAVLKKKYGSLKQKYAALHYLWKKAKSNSKEKSQCRRNMSFARLKMKKVAKQLYRHD